MTKVTHYHRYKTRGGGTTKIQPKKVQSKGRGLKHAVASICTSPSQKQSQATLILKHRKEFDIFEDKVNQELGCKLQDVTSKDSKYEKTCDRILGLFTDYLVGSPYWNDHMKLVEVGEGELWPRLFLAGTCDDNSNMHDKIELVNRSLVDFALQTKKKNGKNYQPNTHANYIRTLLATMQERYNWNYSIDTDFSFKGGLTHVLTKLFQSRQKTEANVSDSCR